MDEITKMKEGLVFVRMVFSDKSVIVCLTTLNENLMREAGVSFVRDHFYDFLKNRFIPFRYDAETVEVDESEPKIREVDKFANRFY
jgi:hypothetical protein